MPLTLPALRHKVFAQNWNISELQNILCLALGTQFNGDVQSVFCPSILKQLSSAHLYWRPSLGLDILKYPPGKHDIAMNAELLPNSWKATEFSFQWFWKIPSCYRKSIYHFSRVWGLKSHGILRHHKENSPLSFCRWQEFCTLSKHKCCLFTWIHLKLTELQRSSSWTHLVQPFIFKIYFSNFAQCPSTIKKLRSYPIKFQIP